MSSPGRPLAGAKPVPLKAKFRVPRFDLETRPPCTPSFPKRLRQAAFRWDSDRGCDHPGVERGVEGDPLGPGQHGRLFTVGWRPGGGSPGSRLGRPDHGSATFECNQSQAKYGFSYVTTLPWLIINEYYDARQWDFHLSALAPITFRKAATEALESYLSTELEDLPITSGRSSRPRRF